MAQAGDESYLPGKWRDLRFAGRKGYTRGRRCLWGRLLTVQGVSSCQDLTIEAYCIGLAILKVVEISVMKSGECICQQNYLLRRHDIG